jgi:hypothetical protein
MSTQNNDESKGSRKQSKALAFEVGKHPAHEHINIL